MDKNRLGAMLHMHANEIPDDPDQIITLLEKQALKDQHEVAELAAQVEELHVEMIEERKLKAQGKNPQGEKSPEVKAVEAELQKLNEAMIEKQIAEYVKMGKLEPGNSQLACAKALLMGQRITSKLHGKDASVRDVFMAFMDTLPARLATVHLDCEGCGQPMKTLTIEEARDKAVEIGLEVSSLVAGARVVQEQMIEDNLPGDIDGQDAALSVAHILEAVERKLTVLRGLA